MPTITMKIVNIISRNVMCYPYCLCVHDHFNKTTQSECKEFVCAFLLNRCFTIIDLIFSSVFVSVVVTFFVRRNEYGRDDCSAEAAPTLGIQFDKSILNVRTFNLSLWLCDQRWCSRWFVTNCNLISEILPTIYEHTHITHKLL